MENGFGDFYQCAYDDQRVFVMLDLMGTLSVCACQMKRSVPKSDWGFQVFSGYAIRLHRDCGVCATA